VISPSGFPVSLASADFNGDGKADIAVLADTASTAIVSIYPGNGDGTFNFKTSFSTGFASVWTTAASQQRRVCGSRYCERLQSFRISVFAGWRWDIRPAIGYFSTRPH
jgi:VCBS repeat protein